jgi:NADH:ubiquinone oxidoreductase subunit 5 (subunit L)/multisubunit Na+/H+ antiporter MnhA subunit
LGFGPTLVSDFLDKVVGRQSWEAGGAFDVALTLVTMLIAASLFVAARRMKPWSAVVPWAQRLLEHKYYFDEIYAFAFVRPMDGLANVLFRDVETVVIDGGVGATGEAAKAVAGSFSLTQSGYFRNYVLVFVGGAIAAASILLLARAGS